MFWLIIKNFNKSFTFTVIRGEMKIENSFVLKNQEKKNTTYFLDTIRQTSTQNPTLSFKASSGINIDLFRVWCPLVNQN